MMKFDEKLIKTVKGFMDEEEGETLYKAALEVASMGPCLEIGSYCGKSSIYLGSACREKMSILFSIDHHRGSEEQQPGEEYFDPELFDYNSFNMDTFHFFRETLERAGLEETVVPIVSKSRTVARSWSIPLSLVFIDGGHSYQAAWTDYCCWARHISQGGYLMIHDIFKDAEKGGQAPYLVYQKALASGLFDERSMVKTLGVLQRKIC